MIVESLFLLLSSTFLARDTNSSSRNNFKFQSVPLYSYPFIPIKLTGIKSIQNCFQRESRCNWRKAIRPPRDQSTRENRVVAEIGSICVILGPTAEWHCYSIRMLSSRIPREKWISNGMHYLPFFIQFILNHLFPLHPMRCKPNFFLFHWDGFFFVLLLFLPLFLSYLFLSLSLSDPR